VNVAVAAASRPVQAPDTTHPSSLSSPDVLLVLGTSMMMMMMIH